MNNLESIKKYLEDKMPTDTDISLGRYSLCAHVHYKGMLMQLTFWEFEESGTFEVEMYCFDAFRKINILQEKISTINNPSIFDVVERTQRGLVEFEKMEEFYKHHMKLEKR